MGLTDRKVARAYEPYRKEAMYCFIDYQIAWILFAILYCIVRNGTENIDISADIIVAGLYLFGLLFGGVINFRIVLLSKMEERKSLYVQEEVQIIQFTEEYSMSGKYGSIIPKLYPQKLGVTRYRFKCIDSNKKRLVLRRAMGNKNAQMISDEIYKKNRITHTVLYGKYTHIIIDFLNKDDIATWLSRGL